MFTTLTPTPRSAQTRRTVISASTQKLSEEVYGSMLLGIPNIQFDRAWQFFRTIPNLQAEEVSVDVH